MTIALSVSGLTAGYGDAQVLHGIDLVCRQGSVTALLGSNGAGKSTLFRTLAGLLKTRSGRIDYLGSPIHQTPSHHRVEEGLVLVPEGRLIFPDLSVEENLRIGAVNNRARARWQITIKEVFEMFPRLLERRTQSGATLSGGEQQMLALGRGLMSLPNLLLLDEPTLGLAPGIARQIFDIIPALIDQDITVMLAEQDVYRTLAISDYAFVIENGQIIMGGSAESLANNPAISSAYLGQ